MPLIIMIMIMIRYRFFVLKQHLIECGGNQYITIVFVWKKIFKHTMYGSAKTGDLFD